ncbi:MAG: hypothetical protein WBM41_03280 [Arenicellales bacterium]
MIDLIHNSLVSAYLRQSIWLYPLINAGHIIGLGLLIGSIAPLDLRLLGIWRTVPISPLVRVLVPVTIAGLALSITCGVMLFITRPGEYLSSALFISKMCFLALGLINAATIRMSAAWKSALSSNLLSNRVRIHSIASMLIWGSVIIFGRLVGYR